MARLESLERALEHRDRLIREFGSELAAVRGAGADERRRLLELETDRQRAWAEHLERQTRRLQSLLDQTVRKLESVYESETWRVGEALLRLPKAVLDLVRRGRRS